MKILVAGCSGQLARSLVEARKPGGWRLFSAGRPALDITSPASVHEQFERLNPDMVINAAAYTAVDRAEEEEEAAFALNRNGPAHLATECARRDVPLIHVSTDYVFDGSKSSPYVEGDPVAPLGVYGRSKLAGEEAVKEIWPKHLILRTAWVISPFGHNFARTMLRLARERDELGIVDDQHGNPTHAPHLAEGILQIAMRLKEAGEGAPWGTYHMTGSGEATWFSLARKIFACSRERGGPWAKARPIATSDYPTPAARPANSRLDCAKLEQAFGVRLPNWREGVRDCVKRILQEKTA